MKLLKKTGVLAVAVSIVGVLFIGFSVFAAPTTSFFRNIGAEIGSTYSIGSSGRTFLNSFTDNIYASSSLTVLGTNNFATTTIGQTSNYIKIEKDLDLGTGQLIPTISGYITGFPIGTTALATKHAFGIVEDINTEGGIPVLAFLGADFAASGNLALMGYETSSKNFAITASSTTIIVDQDQGAAIKVSALPLVGSHFPVISSITGGATSTIIANNAIAILEDPSQSTNPQLLFADSDVTGNIGGITFGTTTGAFDINSQATTTHAMGIDIANGCFAIQGTCITGGGGTTDQNWNYDGTYVTPTTTGAVVRSTGGFVTLQYGFNGLVMGSAGGTTTASMLYNDSVDSIFFIGGQIYSFDSQIRGLTTLDIQGTGTSTFAGGVQIANGQRLQVSGIDSYSPLNISANLQVTNTASSTFTGPIEMAAAKIGSLTGLVKAVSGYITTGLASLTSDVSGVLPLANGGTATSTFNSGSVVFSDGTKLTEDTPNFNWDDSNNRLGVQSSSPQSIVSINAPGTVSPFAIGSSTASVMYVAPNGFTGFGEPNPQRQVVIRNDSNGPITVLGLYDANTTNANGPVTSYRSDTTGVGAAAFQEFAAIRGEATIHDHPTRLGTLRFFSQTGATLAQPLTLQGTAVGVGTSTPMTGPSLSIVGSLNQWGAYSHFGTVAPLAGCGATVCTELWGNNNTIDGVQIGVGNTNAGISSYSGVFLNNNLTDSSYTHYMFAGLNGSNYTDSSFGTAFARGGLGYLQNTEGGILIIASTSTTNGIVQIGAGGNGTGNIRTTWTSTGTTGWGTTTPRDMIELWGGNLSIANGGTDPAADSVLGRVSFRSTDASVGVYPLEAASIFAKATNNWTGTASTWDGNLNFSVIKDGATSTAMNINEFGRVGIGTTTQWATLAVNPIAGQAANQFVVGSSTATNFIVNNAGSVGVGTSSPMSAFSVVGSLNQWGAYSHFGTVAPLAGCGATVCTELWGSNNTIDGVQIGVGNTNSGTASYSGVFLNNDKTDATYTHFTFLGLNAFGYTDTSFGTGFALGGLAYLQNTEGAIRIAATTSTVNSLVQIMTGGNGTGNIRTTWTSTGLVGIGTTTPARALTIAYPTRRGELLLIDQAAGYTDTNTLGGTYLASEKGKFTISGMDSQGSGTAPYFTVDQPNSRIAIGTSTPFFSGTTIAGGAAGTANVLNIAPVSSGDETLRIDGNSLQGYTTSGGIGGTTSNIQMQADLGGNILMGTTTGTRRLTVFDSSLAQVAISNGAGNVQWWFRNAGGRFYIASSTLAATATTSLSSVAFTNSGIGFASDTPWKAFSVAGTVAFTPSLITTNTGASTYSLCLSSAGEMTKNSDAETCIASSIRFKTNINGLPDGLDEVLKLKPVTFEMKDKSNPGEKIGLIAEDTQKVNPLLVSLDEQGLPNGIRWSHITTLLVSSVQHTFRDIQTLWSWNSDQDKKINDMQKQLEQQQKEIENLKKLIK